MLLAAASDQAEIVIAINAGDIEKNKRRGDLGITYDDRRGCGSSTFSAASVSMSARSSLTQYAGQPAADVF